MTLATHTRQVVRATLAVLGATLPLAACGSTTRVPATGIVRVALSEYRLAPASLSARPGALTILVHNYGRLNHNLVISYDGVQEASTEPIRPGQSAELIANLTPGHYVMASTVLADQALGAYGSLDVGR
ncbi:MAG TPA: hypothetical protein VFN55_18400 [Solirubrobacteraceae bacterium]|nr:hypothetical protein [Solirubrobacteraceae bacterium]